MKHYTYMITNTLNDMQYIGVRSCDCEPNEDQYWSSSKYLKEDITKFGIENFTKQILNIWNTREDALEHEISLHEQYNVSTNKLFYNKSKQTSVGFDTTGMPGPCNMLGKKHTEESKQKMSKSKKGKPKTTEHNLKNSLSHRGEKNPFYGKKHTQESIEKIRKASTGKNNPMYGKQHSDEVKQKISQINKGKKRVKVTCPHCGKVGGGPGMKMYHFDNCKVSKSI